MTLEFTTPSGSYTDAISFSVNAPNLIEEPYTMVLVSDYSKKQLQFDLTLEETNERYTWFKMDYTDQLGDLDYSGFYQYTITDTLGNVADQGLVKFINNEPAAVKNQPKHQQSDDNGGGYVIY